MYACVNIHMLAATCSAPVDYCCGQFGVPRCDTLRIRGARSQVLCQPGSQWPASQLLAASSLKDSPGREGGRQPVGQIFGLGFLAI